MRRDAFGLFDHLLRRDRQCRAANNHRTRSIRPHTECDAVGIAVDELYVIWIDAKTLTQDLLEHRLVALAVRLSAHQPNGAATWVEANLSVFRRWTRRLFDRVSEADATQHAPRAGRLAPSGEVGVVGRLQCEFHVALELAAIIEGPERNS